MLRVSSCCVKKEREKSLRTEKTIFLAGKKKGKGGATHKKNSSLFFLSFSLKEE